MMLAALLLPVPLPTHFLDHSWYALRQPRTAAVDARTATDALIRKNKLPSHLPRPARRRNSPSYVAAPLRPSLAFPRELRRFHHARIIKHRSLTHLRPLFPAKLVGDVSWTTPHSAKVMDLVHALPGSQPKWGDVARSVPTHSAKVRCAGRKSSGLRVPVARSRARSGFGAVLAPISDADPSRAQECKELYEFLSSVASLFDGRVKLAPPAAAGTQRGAKRALEVRLVAPPRIYLALLRGLSGPASPPHSRRTAAPTAERCCVQGAGPRCQAAQGDDVDQVLPVQQALARFARR